MLKLHQHQNAVQRQQNKIVEMLATQQKKSYLPQAKIPIFDGDPMEYGPFFRAFENIIKSKTTSESERLYYLEQFTSGDVKDRIKSCQYLPPEKGYQEARRLMKKKFGDDYHFVAAYETRALNWHEVKAEDSAGLNKFFKFFLMRCKNTMEGSEYLTKLKQPDTIKKLILKLPFSLRKTWRRLADHITETEKRSVKFSDLAEFVENEARISTNAVFGKIVDKVDTRNSRSQSSSGQGGKRTRELSLATQVGCDHSLSSISSPARSPASTEDILCVYCYSRHALETCDALRRLPYQDRIQFLISKNLCFGCLSQNDATRICPERKKCTVPSCGRKHLTILHTNSASRNKPANSPPTSSSSREETAHVRARPADSHPTSSSSREETAHFRNGMINLGRSK